MYYFAFVLLALSMLCALAGAAWAVKSLWPRTAPAAGKASRRTSVPGLGFVEKANLCLTGCYIIASAILIYALASYDFSLVYVASYTDRLLEQIWSCIASLVVLSAILICGYDPWAVDPLFPALLLIGAGLFISGQVIRNRYMYYASCIVVPIGFGITRDSWLNADPDYNLLQFAAAILIGLTGAGYALRRQVRRDADKVAKSNDAHD